MPLRCSLGGLYATEWDPRSLMDVAKLHSAQALGERERSYQCLKDRGLPTRVDYFAEYGFPITTSVTSTARPTCSRPLHVSPDSNDTPPSKPPSACAQTNNNCAGDSTSSRTSTSTHELGDLWIHERTLVFCRYVFCRSDMYVLHHALRRPKFWMLRLCRPELRLCLHLHRLQYPECIRGRILVPTRR